MEKPNRVELNQLWQFSIGSEDSGYKYIGKIIEIKSERCYKIKIIKSFYNNSKHPRNLGDEFEVYDVIDFPNFTYIGMNKIICEKCKR